MASRALWEGIVCGSTQHSRTAHGLVLMISGGSTSMFRHNTRAAFTVLIFPGEEPRHGMGFEDHGRPGIGLPHVRCRLADQYGINEAGSGSVSTDPFSRPSRLSVLLVFCVWEEGSERDVERYSRSVSESESGLVRDPFLQGPAPAAHQSNRGIMWNAPYL